jgi:hypothetical protein
MTGLDPKQLAIWVIQPSLDRLGPLIPSSKAAIQLVLGTAMAESQLTYLDQIDKAGKPGPAYGLWQMEKITFDDHLLRMRDPLIGGMFGYMSIPPDVSDLHWNLRLGAAMCRLLYWHAPEKLPLVGDAEGMSKLWKKRYNTYLGAHTWEWAFLFFDKACEAYP